MESHDPIPYQFEKSNTISDSLLLRMAFPETQEAPPAPQNLKSMLNEKKGTYPPPFFSSPNNLPFGLSLQELEEGVVLSYFDGKDLIFECGEKRGGEWNFLRIVKKDVGGFFWK